jgi:hypothetical protein
MWVNADSFSNQFPTVISGMNNSTNTNNGSIWMNSSKIVIHGSTLYGEVAFSFSTSTWYHVGMVYDSVANTVKAIINGQLYTPSSTTSNTFPSNNKMRIGSSDSSVTRWDGKIDQVRFYKGAISDFQVAELYAETASQNDDLELGGPPETIISANANAGFSIVKYEGDGVSGKQVPHGLSATPNLILIKCISDGSTNWIVHHSSLGNSKYLTLNDNSVADTSTNWLVPSATTFALNQTFGNANTSGRQYIAYCWHSISGYSAFGSYAGNGTSQSINIGFKPDLLILRKYDDNQDWMIWDSVRDGNPKEARLEANNSDAEVSGTTNINFISTGFEFTSGFYNDSGQNSIYMAFKMNPTPYPLAGNMSFLVVAGGASGGRTNAGGGGAGGLRTSYGGSSGGGASAESDITLAAGTYTITIGAGGAALTSNGVGNNGVDSSIAAAGLTTITSVGGGGGFGSSGASSAGSGGSGGGAGTNTSNSASGFGSGTANQGFDGGARNAAANTYAGGGGGGASAAGQTSPGQETGGAGGAGLAVKITGSSVTYAGGGGGGGGYNGGAAGAGGAGGGTAGGYINDAVSDATANTGGGSGGTRNAVTAGSGGSGVVILRLLTSEYSGTTTGSPTVTTDGDYSILKYTGSGTYVHS